METKISDQGNHQKVVVVDVPADEMQPHLESVYRKYQKTIRLEGFRKGKVPLALVKQLYGKQIESEAIEEIVQDLYQEVKEEENIKAVAPAKLEDVNYTEESGLHFKAVVEVVPEFELKRYKDLTIEREVYEVSDDDVAEALEDVRDEMAVMNPIEEAAQEDHFVLADFQEIDPAGVPVIGKKFVDRFFQLSKEAQNKEIAEQLIGVKAGETRRVTIAADHNGQEQAHDEIYEVKVKEVKEKQLPELDDELAKDVGNFQTLDQLKEDIRKRLIRQTEAGARRRLHQALIDEVLKNNLFEIPETMISNYLDVLFESAQRDSNDQLDEEQFKRDYRANAIWNLKWMLVMEKLAEIENIVVTDEDRQAYVHRLSEERRLDEKKLWKSFRSKEAQKRLNDDVLEQKVLDFLEQHAKVRDKKVTRKDLETSRLAEIA
ncbi:MAG: trigger factor [bacterium]